MGAFIPFPHCSSFILFSDFSFTCKVTPVEVAFLAFTKYHLMKKANFLLKDIHMPLVMPWFAFLRVSGRQGSDIQFYLLCYAFVFLFVFVAVFLGK